MYQSDIGQDQEDEIGPIETIDGRHRQAQRSFDALVQDDEYIQGLSYTIKARCR